jgi:hypothetical protein
MSRKLFVNEKSPNLRRWRSNSTRMGCLKQLALRHALKYGLVAGSALARVAFAVESQHVSDSKLDGCIAEQLPSSGSRMISLRCGDLKLYGVATMRSENGTKVCMFGPIVAPSEGDQLAAVPASWRAFPFARLRLERAEASSGGADPVVQTVQHAAQDSWLIEVPEILSGLIVDGNCTVGRLEPDVASDGSRPQGTVSFTGFDQLASVHERAIDGWQLGSRIRRLKDALADESIGDEARRELEGARAAADRAARAWLRPGARLPPPYAFEVVAWIEEMDARQYLHRALGEVKAADRAVDTIRAHARAIGANGIVELLAERVPAGQGEATSLCLHRCWISDASEVVAISTRAFENQRRFVADLRSAISRESECGRDLVEVAGRSLDRLLGTLPPASRLDERIKGIAVSELADQCGADLDRSGLHGIAMTIALKVYTACWSEEIERYPELANRLAEWRDTLRQEILSVLESPAYASALPPEDMPQVAVLAIERLESAFNDGVGYFTAFPPSLDFQRQLLAQHRAFASNRAMTGRESSDANRRRVANQVTSDLLECLYEGTAMKAARREDLDAYPRPFEFGPKSFRVWGHRLRWSIGP